DRDIQWPEGRRCAVHIVVDLSVASGPDGIVTRDIESPAAEFGAHEGLDMLLSVLEKNRLRATFAVPAVTAQIYPARIKALIERGHEVAAHGLRHEDVSLLERNEEKARLDATTRLLTDVTGRKPVGWFSLPRQTDPFAGGTISPNTMDLL